MHILVTRRLTLRQPSTLDAEDIALWLSNWAVARMLARVPFPYAEADAEDWITSLAGDPDAMVYTIHRERLIGIVSIEGEGPEPELGYWIAEPWHGRGFVTEAARALIGHAFATRDIAAVRSSAFVDNPASQRVQRKLGFAVCGGGSAWSVPRNEMVSLVKSRLTRAAFLGAKPEPAAAHAA